MLLSFFFFLSRWDTDQEHRTSDTTSVKWKTNPILRFQLHRRRLTTVTANCALPPNSTEPANCSEPQPGSRRRSRRLQSTAWVSTEKMKLDNRLNTPSPRSRRPRRRRSGRPRRSGSRPPSPLHELPPVPEEASAEQGASAAHQPAGDGAEEGKPQSTASATASPFPPRPRRPHPSKLHAGAPIWGFPSLPPPERPSEGGESTRYAGGSWTARSRLPVASLHCSTRVVSRNRGSVAIIYPPTCPYAHNL